MATVVLSQTASWNPALTNGYRDRYATVGGRYFKVSAEFLYTPWFISEITADGEWIPDGFSGIAFTLAEARTQISDATATS
jgi:hypothetical protein